jgi:hypothetical protein
MWPLHQVKSIPPTVWAAALRQSAGWQRAERVPAGLIRLHSRTGGIVPARLVQAGAALDA